MSVQEIIAHVTGNLLGKRRSGRKERQCVAALTATVLGGSAGSEERNMTVPAVRAEAHRRGL